MADGIWKRTPSFSTHEVSNCGNVRRRVTVRNWKKGRMLTPHTDQYGYRRVKLGGSPRAIHNVVCEAFNGPRPPGKICRHLNDIKSDNGPKNLSWGTHLENNEDAHRNGRVVTTPRRFDRVEAARLFGIGLNHKEIGYFLGVSSRSIYYALEDAGAAGKD
jgi:hypothetical protein